MPDTTETETNAEEQTAATPFAQVIREYRNGTLHDELSTELQSLIGECVDTGKKGKLVLTLTVIPDDAGEVIQLDAQVNAKPPRHDLPTALFYRDKSNNNLRRMNPNQGVLPGLTAVEARGADITDLKEVK